MEAFILEVAELSNGHPEINRKLDELKGLLSDKIREVDARRLIELMAKLWSASLLVNRGEQAVAEAYICLLYTSPSPRDLSTSRMPSSA